jgi:osmotically-inducible protein OsmY
MERTRFSLAVIASSAILVGCSNQTREEYSQAGSIAGNAINKDVAIGVKVAKKAGKAAKQTLEEDKIKGEQESRQLSDASATPKIKSALASAENLHSSKIEVTTVGKHVTLSGTVPTAQEKHRAATIADGIVGSSYTVTNSITVSGG